jgi:hypothetical protein
MTCACEFDPIPDDPDEGTPETAWHYLRHCDACGTDWYSLHCRHDAAQGRCPDCGTRPPPEPEGEPDA